VKRCYTDNANCSTFRTITLLTVTVPPPAPTSTDYVYYTEYQSAPYTSMWTSQHTVTGNKKLHNCYSFIPRDSSPRASSAAVIPFPMVHVVMATLKLGTMFLLDLIILIFWPVTVTSNQPMATGDCSKLVPDKGQCGGLNYRGCSQCEGWHRCYSVNRRFLQGGL
jgi:hypothetical protein